MSKNLSPKIFMMIMFVVSGINCIPPTQWPNQFDAVQVQYFPTFNNAQQHSFTNYDFEHLRFANEHTLVRGSLPVGQHTKEFWLGDDLYIYDLIKESCVHIPIGMKMPKPDWFLHGATNKGGIYLVHPYADAARNETNNFVSPTTWLQKPSVDNLPPFNYWSRNDTGYAYRIEAPSGGISHPDPPCLNDFYNFTARQQPNSAFERPDINCTGLSDILERSQLNDDTNSAQRVFDMIKRAHVFSPYQLLMGHLRFPLHSLME